MNKFERFYLGRSIRGNAQRYLRHCALFGNRKKGVHSFVVITACRVIQRQELRKALGVDVHLQLLQQFEISAHESSKLKKMEVCNTK
jgi:hypothetical protein